MHEMLTLQHLFAGDSDLGTVKQIMEMEIPQSVGAAQRRAGGAGANGDARAGAGSRANGSRRAAEMARGAGRLRRRVEAARRGRRQLRARDRRGGGGRCRCWSSRASCAADVARACSASRATRAGARRVRIARRGAAARVRAATSRTRAVVALGVTLGGAGRRDRVRSARDAAAAIARRSRRAPAAARRRAARWRGRPARGLI